MKFEQVPEALKNFANSTKKTSVLETLFNKVAILKALLKSSCEICKIFKNILKIPVALSGVSLEFLKESGMKTGATVSDKYQIQVKKKYLMSVSRKLAPQ